MRVTVRLVLLISGSLTIVFSGAKGKALAAVRQ